MLDFMKCERGDHPCPSNKPMTALMVDPSSVSAVEMWDHDGQWMVAIYLKASSTAFVQTFTTETKAQERVDALTNPLAAMATQITHSDAALIVRLLKDFERHWATKEDKEQAGQLIEKIERIRGGA